VPIAVRVDLVLRGGAVAVVVQPITRLGRAGIHLGVVVVAVLGLVPTVAVCVDGRGVVVPRVVVTCVVVIPGVVVSRVVVVAGVIVRCVVVRSVVISGIVVLARTLARTPTASSLLAYLDTVVTAEANAGLGLARIARERALVVIRWRCRTPRTQGSDGEDQIE